MGEEEPGHLEVIDGDIPCFKSTDHFWWPSKAPHNGVDVLVARDPDSSRPVFAGITETNVVRSSRDQLLAVYGVASHYPEHSA